MGFFKFKRPSKESNIIAGVVPQPRIKNSRVRAALYVAVFAVIGSIVIAIFAAPPSKGCTTVCVLSPAAGSIHTANFEIKTTATPPTGTASYSHVVTLDANTDKEQIVDVRVQQTAVSGTQTYTFKGGPSGSPNLFDYKLLAPGAHTVTVELYTGTAPTDGALLGSTLTNFTINKVNNLATNTEAGKIFYAPKIPYNGNTLPRSVAVIDESSRDLLSRVLESIEPTASAQGQLTHTDVVIDTKVTNSYSGDVNKDKVPGNAYVELGNGGQVAYPGDYPTTANPLQYACTGGSQPYTIDVRDQGSVSFSGVPYKNSIIYIYSRTGPDGKLTLSNCAVNNIWNSIGIGTFQLNGGSPSGYNLTGVKPATGTLGKFLDPYNGSPAQRFTFEMEALDSDEDGIPENGADKCPSQAGPSASEGCPSVAFDPLNGPLIGLTNVANDKATFDIFAAGVDGSGNPKGVLKNISVKVDGKVTDTQDLGAGPTATTITDRTVNLGNIADGKMHDVLISAYNNNGESISKLRFYINPNSGPASESPTAQTSSAPEESSYNEAVAYSAAAKKKTRDIVVNTRLRPNESLSYKKQTLQPIAKLTVTAKNINAKPQCNDLVSAPATGVTAGKNASYKFLKCPLLPHKPPYYPKAYQLTAEVPAGHHVNKEFATQYSVTTQTVNGKVVAVRNYILKRKPPFPASVTFVFDKTTSTNPASGPAPAPTAVKNPPPAAIPDQTANGKFIADAAQKTLEYTNNERTAQGLTALQFFNPKTDASGSNAAGRDTAFRFTMAARAHAIDMATTGYFSHMSAPDPDSNPPHCRSYVDRVKAMGISDDGYAPPTYTTFGENLALMGTGDFYADMHAKLMASPDHRKNIMNPDFRYMTVASLQDSKSFVYHSFNTVDPNDPKSAEICGPFKEPSPSPNTSDISLVVILYWGEPEE